MSNALLLMRASSLASLLSDVEPSGVSGESQRIRDGVTEVRDSLESSHALFGDRAAVISQIWEAVNEGGSTDGDGAGTETLQLDSAFRAVSLVRALPVGAPMPEVSIDPDGELSLDWGISRHARVSVSVGSTGRLAWAWIDGSAHGHAVESFDGMTFPDRIWQAIVNIMARGATLGPS